MPYTLKQLFDNPIVKRQLIRGDHLQKVGEILLQPLNFKGVNLDFLQLQVLPVLKRFFEVNFLPICDLPSQPAILACEPNGHFQEKAVKTGFWFSYLLVELNHQVIVVEEFIRAIRKTNPVSIFRQIQGLLVF